MSDNLSSKTALVFDHNLFLSFAQRISRDFGRVLYHTPWQEGFSTIADNMVGDGLEDVERCEEPWALIDKGEVDICCFPDIQWADLQLHIESLDIPVWGSRRGDVIEWSREKFKSMQKEFKSPQPVYRSIVGIDNLRAYLKEHDNCFIKFSKYRGAMESRRHYTYELSEQWLDFMAFRQSPIKHLLRFMVEDLLATDFEFGVDAPACIDGELPDTLIQAVEVKDCGSFGAVTAYKDLDKQLREPVEKFLPFLKECRYRNQLSTEIRLKDGVGYFTDPCCRMASPCGEPVLELVDNFSEIVWHGAQGELVQPEFNSKFVVQSMIRHKDDPDHWRAIQVPDKLTKFVKLYRACKTGGEAYQIVPLSPHLEEVGSVLGMGDTIEKAIDNLKEHVKALEGNPISIDTDAIYSAIKQVRDADKEGIYFTDAKIPHETVALE